MAGAQLRGIHPGTSPPRLRCSRPLVHSPKLRWRNPQGLATCLLSEPCGATKIPRLLLIWLRISASRTDLSHWPTTRATETWLEGCAYDHRPSRSALLQPAAHFCLLQVIVPTITTACVYVLPNHTFAQANANPDAVAGWIFEDVRYALSLAPAGCTYDMSSFDHTCTVIQEVSSNWGGIAYTPGNQLIVKIGYGVDTAFHECQ
jgi:hypothetical protein